MICTYLSDYYQILSLQRTDNFFLYFRQKRALWKYSTDRAMIAARWTWLQAQIADLEYRIRQHTDLHKQIRLNKGVIQLGGASPPHTATSVSQTALNGYRGQLPGSSPLTSKAADSSGAENLSADYQCARTRPLVKFRKRKLLQISGLHAVSRKAARPSTVRCGCVPLSNPCALCTGRTDPTHPRDPPDTFSRSEKVALLDPGFHPVVSLPEGKFLLTILFVCLFVTKWCISNLLATIRHWVLIIRLENLFILPKKYLE